MTELEFLRQVQRSYEALLTTLGASKSRWIQMVVKTSRARYEFLKYQKEDS